MTLNACEKAHFKQLAKEAVEQNAKPLIELTIEEYRTNSKLLFDENCGAPADVSFKDMTIPARDKHPIAIRMFNHDLPKTTPVIFYFPACGYMGELFVCNAVAASRIAKQAGCRVIIVDTRLAPEYPMPTGALDGYDVVKAVAQRAEEFQIDPTQIVVSGLSSGGHNAVLIGHLARADDVLSIQQVITLGAWLDMARSTPGFEAFEKEDGMANQDAIDFLNLHHNFNEDNVKDPLISPFYEKDLSNLPIITMLTGEHDGIRADTEGYYQRLLEAGARAEKIVIPGQTHCTMLLRPILHEGPDPAELIADAAKKHFK